MPHTPSNTDAARLKRVKRKAAHEDHLITKIREDSEWYAEYGPFMVVNMAGRRNTGTVVASGLTLDDLEREYETTTTTTQRNDA